MIQEILINNYFLIFHPEVMQLPSPNLIIFCIENFRTRNNFLQSLILELSEFSHPTDGKKAHSKMFYLHVSNISKRENRKGKKKF